MLSKFHQIFDSLTRLERQIFQGAIIVFILASLLNGANAFYRKTVLAPIEGGSYTEGVVGQPISLNPLISAQNDADRDLMEVIFSDLGELLEKSKVNDDGKTWVLELKENLLWSDGEPLTADDVVFTLEAIQNPDSHSPLALTWQSVTAEKLNEREIRFSLKTAYAFLLDNLKALKIVPQHIFGAIPAANLRLSDYNLEPVGSGPYAFSKFLKRRDGFIVQYQFTANPFYHGPKPLIQELNFKFFQNYQEAIAAFNKKEIEGLGGLSPAQIPELKIGHEIQEIQIPRYYAIFLNSSTAPALKNKEVRLALGLTTDRSKIIETVFGGRALAISGPLYPSIEGYDPEFDRQSEFSREAARELLEKNKWRPDAEGILLKKIGSEELKLDFEIIVPQIDFLVEAVNLIAEDWRSLGIRIQPIVLSATEVANDVIKTRNYQMIIFGNILKNNPDVFSFWHSSERFYPGLNLALYENRIADEILETIRKTLDANVRVRNARKLQSLIAEDQPAIFLFSPNYLYAGPKNLGGLNLRFAPSPANRFDEISKWYLKTARVFK